MSRLTNIPKDEGLYTAIKLSIIDFENSLNLSRGTGRTLIIEALGLSSVKELNNFFNTYENKYLRIEEFFIILNCFETEQQKIILDYIANKYNFVLSPSAPDSNLTNNPDFSIFNINAVSGQLNQKYFDYKQDDNLSEFEIQNLLQQSYLVRQTLKNFENNLKGLL